MSLIRKPVIKTTEESRIEWEDDSRVLIEGRTKEGYKFLIASCGGDYQGYFWKPEHKDWCWLLGGDFSLESIKQELQDYADIVIRRNQQVELETSESITKWAESVFGPVEALAIGIRMLHEVSELLSKLAHQETFDCFQVLEECADIRIMLSQIEFTHGCSDPAKIVNEKMKINRNREWDTTPGKSRHI